LSQADTDTHMAYVYGYTDPSDHVPSRKMISHRKHSHYSRGGNKYGKLFCCCQVSAHDFPLFDDTFSGKVPGLACSSPNTVAIEEAGAHLFFGVNSFTGQLFLTPTII